MTLNASGPISLGGATTGQSINIELGQSATALASINATNFRSLAGVPSGQIALSNFYGKSSTTGYVIYLGTSYLSSSNQTGDLATDLGWQVNQLGTSMYGMGRNGKVTFINNAGVTLATTAPTIVDYEITLGIQNLFPAGSDRFITGNGNGNTKTYVWSGSSSYTVPVAGAFNLSTNRDQSYIGMPDNSIVICGIQDQGKYGFKPRFLKGSGSTVQLYTGSDNSVQNSGFKKILRYSDGSFVYFNLSGSSLFIWNLTSSLTGSTLTRTVNDTNYYWGAEVDSSNNIYLLGLNYVYKIPSNFPGTITKYQYNTVNWAVAYTNQISPQNAFGMGIYNNILYVATNGGSATDSGSANPLTLTVCAITCSTMAVLWTKRFVCNGAFKFFRPFTDGGLSGNGGNGIQVNALGVYISFALCQNYSAGYGYGYNMFLPLDGNVANQTFTPADSGTPSNTGSITITSPTTTVTSSNISLNDPGGTYTISATGGGSRTVLSFQAGSGLVNVTPKTAF